jgi:hypothetical protein
LTNRRRAGPSCGAIAIPVVMDARQEQPIFLTSPKDLDHWSHFYIIFLHFDRGCTSLLDLRDPMFSTSSSFLFPQPCVSLLDKCRAKTWPWNTIWCFVARLNCERGGVVRLSLHHRCGLAKRAAFLRWHCRARGCVNIVVVSRTWAGDGNSASL